MYASQAGLRESRTLQKYRRDLLHKWALYVSGTRNKIISEEPNIQIKFTPYFSTTTVINGDFSIS